MTYAYLADLVMIIHFLFIAYMVFGGLMVFRWPRLAYIHIPAFIYGGMIGVFGWICLLTYVENDLRHMAGGAGRGLGFVELFIMPLIYPELLFPDGFPENGFLWLSLVLVGFNLVIYGTVWMRRRK